MRHPSRIAAAALVAVAATAAVTAIATAAAAGPAEPDPVGPVVTAEEAAVDVGPATPLVPWTGPQPGPISTELVPHGWEVQGGDAGSLVLAPIGAADRDYSASYDGKIVVLLEADAVLDEPNAEVEGLPAVLVPDDPYHHYAHVYVPRAGGAVHLQVPPTTGNRWSDEELLALAAGIDVADGAEPTFG